MGTSVVRATTVAGAVAVLLVVIAALTAALWTFFGPTSNEQAGQPLPRATVTADPDNEVPGGATGPITAQALPEDQVLVDEPPIIVGPGIDVSQHSIDDPASPWVVVNKTRPLDPQSWEPPQLELVGEAQMVPEAAVALENMIAAAGDEDLALHTGTGYRAYDYQEHIYTEYREEFGADSADRFSARPGFSEHQTGWAVDLYGTEQCRIQECFAHEPVGLWLAEHAHEHGYVIRYPQGAEDVTGYRFEPWHLRYVGVELATAMRETGIATLEVAFGLPPAPDYN